MACKVRIFRVRVRGKVRVRVSVRVKVMVRVYFQGWGPWKGAGSCMSIKVITKAETHRCVCLCAFGEKPKSSATPI